MTDFKSDELVLCATHRQARTLRVAAVTADAVSPAPGGVVRVPTTATIAQWLDEFAEETLLCGDIEASDVPYRVLAPQPERLLWAAVIRESLGEDEAAALFDVSGLAAEASVANELLEIWSLDFEPARAGEEARRMIAWRNAFWARCRQRNWVSAAAHRVWQVGLVERGLGCLPARVTLAGFDRLDPLERRLCDALVARGTRVEHLQPDEATAAAAAVEQVVLDDADAECRAAVQWAADVLAGAPGATIGIVVPDLSARRARLTRLLDHAFAPYAVGARHAQRQRPYNLSLGLRLAELAPISIALSLLRLAASAHGFAQTELGALLNRPYWGADVTEADARARFDLMLRARLPLRTTLAGVIRFARRSIVEGLPLKQTTNAFEHLGHLLDKVPARQLPSAWRDTLDRLLAALGWPGERSLSSHDFQACSAFRDALDALPGLDDIVGPVSLGAAIAHLTEACRERVFQPETEGVPRIQVLGMLEAASERFDAVWVMGMNDHLWPPPVRPSPLLPAELQRDTGCPNASPEIQLAFAGGIHRRLLHAGAQIVFSSAARDGESELRVSPLVAGLPKSDRTPPRAPTLGERRCAARLAAGVDLLERIEDHVAPALIDGDAVRGGTGLFRTQAICPAWAYFRHRLGAEPLETPVEGLDARERGSLVHAVLERFWRGRSSRDLASLGAAGRVSAIAAAVDAGIALFCAQRETALPPRFLALERSRLIALLELWLAFEDKREAAFSVMACEQKVEVEIDGIALRLVADRIDLLDDGRRLILDYKTGATIDASSWAAERITEPQLPIYATRVASEHPLAGIAFAQVRLSAQKFAGIAADSGLLPGVAGLEGAGKLFDASRFPDWEAVLAHWRTALGNIAAEIRRGEAAVRFTRERDLEYCELRPILRLPERRAQYAQLQADARAGCDRDSAAFAGQLGCGTTVAGDPGGGAA